jgi:hypothetical protein
MLIGGAVVWVEIVKPHEDQFGVHLHANHDPPKSWEVREWPTAATTSGHTSNSPVARRW